MIPIKHRDTSVYKDSNFKIVFDDGKYLKTSLQWFDLPLYAIFCEKKV